MKTQCAEHNGLIFYTDNSLIQRCMTRKSDPKKWPGRKEKPESISDDQYNRFSELVANLPLVTEMDYIT